MNMTHVYKKQVIKYMLLFVYKHKQGRKKEYMIQDVALDYLHWTSQRHSFKLVQFM